MFMSQPLFDLHSFASTESAYSGAPLDTEYCQYNIYIYPSNDYENIYMTKNPWIFTISCTLIFVFASCVFFIYDCFVERRQKLVMDKAVTTNAIVTSLFPTAVRERILHETRNSEYMTNKNKNQSPLNNVSTVSNTKGILIYNTMPLASLYPDTTIFFGDIAGFTSWSSSRDASQVFILLETMYGTFDQIAKRHKVFKVETIGDCYVAVTGLPEPDQYHAITMAKFSRDCLHKMKDIVDHLEVTLGPDTADLSLRIGLNSGPTTAGVLRGDKSRFQLFGDTVNTGKLSLLFPQ
jgi:Adenylate and Guanylate cyclase catalytic domain